MAKKVTFDELLEAGAHFGHLTRKWDPSMAPYIFGEKKGVHIIDLNKTIAKVETAAAAVEQIAKSGKKILFVATKKQAKDVISENLEGLNMPFVTERWSGGMLTNFTTTRKSIRKMNSIDKMFNDGTALTLSKRERLQLTRLRDKLDKNLGSISDMSRLPAALFIVDIKKEHLAIKEAKKLNIPTFAIVDTNSNPNEVDFAIPANDDAAKSVDVIMKVMADAIKTGLSDRKVEREKQKEAKAAPEAQGQAEETKEEK